jgi:hypothetical protein
MAALLAVVRADVLNRAWEISVPAGLGFAAIAG